MRGAGVFGPFLRAGCAGAAWVHGGTLGSGMRAGMRCLAPWVDFWTLECVFRGNVGIHRAPKTIQVDDSRPRRVSLRGFPCSSLSGTLASYGASAVARTSGRGHV